MKMFIIVAGILCSLAGIGVAEVPLIENDGFTPSITVEQVAPVEYAIPLEGDIQRLILAYPAREFSSTPHIYARPMLIFVPRETERPRGIRPGDVRSYPTAIHAIRYENDTHVSVDFVIRFSTPESLELARRSFIASPKGQELMEKFSLIKSPKLVEAKEMPLFSYYIAIKKGSLVVSDFLEIGPVADRRGSRRMTFVMETGIFDQFVEDEKNSFSFDLAYRGNVQGASRGVSNLYADAALLDKIARELHGRSHHDGRYTAEQALSVVAKHLTSVCVDWVLDEQLLATGSLVQLDPQIELLMLFFEPVAAPTEGGAEEVIVSGAFSPGHELTTEGGMEKRIDVSGHSTNETNSKIEGHGESSSVNIGAGLAIPIPGVGSLGVSGGRSDSETAYIQDQNHHGETHQDEKARSQLKEQGLQRFRNVVKPGSYYRLRNRDQIFEHRQSRSVVIARRLPGYEWSRAYTSEITPEFLSKLTPPSVDEVRNPLLFSKYEREMDELRKKNAEKDALLELEKKRSRSLQETLRSALNEL